MGKYATYSLASWVFYLSFLLFQSLPIFRAVRVENGIELVFMLVNSLLFFILVGVRGVGVVHHFLLAVLAIFGNLSLQFMSAFAFTCLLGLECI
jgi:uncharacterized protein YybS (DUF2232 family)